MKRIDGLDEEQLVEFLKLGAAHFQMLDDLDRRGIEPPPFDVDIVEYILGIAGVPAEGEDGLHSDEWFRACYMVLTEYTNERGRDFARRMLVAASVPSEDRPM